MSGGLLHLIKDTYSGNETGAQGRLARTKTPCFRFGLDTVEDERSMIIFVRFSKQMFHHMKME